MFVGAFSWLALTTVLVSAIHEVDFSRWSTTIVSLAGGEFLCDATLVTYSSALTTCECATHTDFIFPEFFLRKPEEYNLTTRRSNYEYAYQARGVKKFSLHPKCTSNNLITGFFSFNYAIAETKSPFQDFDKAILPIDLPTVEYRIVNFTLWQALGEHRSCELLVWNLESHTIKNQVVVPYPHCEDELCSLLGKSCPLSLEEKGIVCLKFYNEPDDYDDDELYSESQMSAEKMRIQSNYSSITARKRKGKPSTGCSGEILSGAPLVCYGFFMGITAPGLCTTEVPFLVARIEPALEFIYQHIEQGVRSSAPVSWPLMTVTLFPALKMSYQSVNHWLQSTTL
uniref:Serine protease 28 n=1 Tax=Lygus hesperus TaxID=30085 RepID=A0A0A9YFV9_LYGHE